MNLNLFDYFCSSNVLFDVYYVSTTTHCYDVFACDAMLRGILLIFSVFIIFNIL